MTGKTNAGIIPSEKPVPLGITVSGELSSYNIRGSSDGTEIFNLSATGETTQVIVPKNTWIELNANSRYGMSFEDGVGCHAEQTGSYSGRMIVFDDTGASIEFRLN